jgi:hypothetical protein
MNYHAVPSRIWAKVEARSDGCLTWQGATTGNETHPYGVAWFGADKGTQTVHRQIYLLVVGSVGQGEHVHHTCGNTLCANPLHMEAKTVRQHIGQWHRDKTHCPNGHPYDEANTRITPEGWRHCRACDRARKR